VLTAVYPGKGQEGVFLRAHYFQTGFIIGPFLCLAAGHKKIHDNGSEGDFTRADTREQFGGNCPNQVSSMKPANPEKSS
jgi:hypothetical protein